MSPAQAATFTLTGLKANDESHDIPARGNIVVEVPFLALDFAMAD